MRQRLATRLMLVNRNPGSGRVPGGRTPAAVSRAALLGELVVTERLAPHPLVADPGRLAGSTGDAGSTAGDAGTGEDDRILAAVAAAVARRPGMPWRRWFTHVEADRRALIEELVATGRWRRDGLGRFTDLDAEATEADRRLLTAVCLHAETPGAALDAFGGCLLSLLAPRGTRPSAKAVRQDWSAVFEAAAGGRQTAEALLALVEAAATGRRRRRRQRRPSLFGPRR